MYSYYGNVYTYKVLSNYVVAIVFYHVNSPDLPENEVTFAISSRGIKD